MNPKNPHARRRKDRDVKSEEPSQGCSRHLVSSAQKADQKMSDDGHDTRYFRSYLGCEKRYGIPVQQVSTEAEGERDKKQQHAAYPGELARFSVCTKKENAKQVDEQYGNK